jgi:hypothetical protein
VSADGTASPEIVCYDRNRLSALYMVELKVMSTLQYVSCLFAYIFGRLISKALG